MQRTIHCSCGYTGSSQDEEELYSLMRGHISRSHPEWHQPIVREGLDSAATYDNGYSPASPRARRDTRVLQPQSKRMAVLRIP